MSRLWRLRSLGRTGRVGLAAAGVLLLSSCMQRASTASDGTQANEESSDASISANGRYVAFDSQASNLAPGDVPGVDVFIKDFATGTTSMITVGPRPSGLTYGVFPVLSADGRHIAFNAAADLVPEDTDDDIDLYHKDLSTGTLTWINTSSTGDPAEGATSSPPAISGEGRYVSFWSLAANLVPGDTNGMPDVFVKDVWTGETSRVSTDGDGVQANGFTYMFPGMSADGRDVTFSSDATNLVPGDTNGTTDLFVKDRITGATNRVSTDSAGAEAAGASGGQAISPEGRYVAFHSEATNLVPGDTNGITDVFVKDRTTGATTRVSTSTSGAQGDNTSSQASMSADGRYVTFASSATNLVAGDTNGTFHVFVKDRTTGSTTRVNVGSGGAQADNFAVQPVISADGGYIAFVSRATNLVNGDTNGRADVFRATRP